MSMAKGIEAENADMYHLDEEMLPRFDDLSSTLNFMLLLVRNTNHWITLFSRKLGRK